MTVRSVLDGRISAVEADTLVLATTNIPDSALANDLVVLGRQPHVVGDAVAARLAVHAIYEGRAVAMTF